MTNHPDKLEETRRNLRLLWLECIAEFGDLELQTKAWAGGPDYDSPYWTFVEWMCRYFDDLGASRGYKSLVEFGYVGEAEAEAVAEFHAAADRYSPPNGDSYDHQAILNDPKWRNVVALADAARIRLLETTNDVEERQILSRSIG